MHILFAASECFPFVKIGGLADVVGGLPKALSEQNVDVSIVIPHYSELKIEGLKVNREILKFQVLYGNKNHEVVVNQVFLPESRVPVYLLENKMYLSNGGIYTNQELHPENEIDRFVFFSKAVIFFLKLVDWQSPRLIDTVHCHDWHTALIPLLLKKYLPDKNIKTLLTIHNLGRAYQGMSSREIINKLQVEDSFFTINNSEKKVNILKQGIVNADIVSTVSKSYAEEIQTEQAGEGLDVFLRAKKRIFGILNGIDYTVWNPYQDKIIPYPFSADQQELLKSKESNKNKLIEQLNLSSTGSEVLLGMVTRIAEQKGFDIFLPVAEELVKNKKIRIVVLGVGDPKYEGLLDQLCVKFPDQVSFLKKFDEYWAHLIYASSDFFLMPSRFEPSGLGQLIAMRYGTLPVARKTGGLADSVIEGETGFIFDEYSVPAFQRSLEEAILLFQNYKEKYSMMVKKALECDFSWSKSAGEYLELYNKIG